MASETDERQVAQLIEGELGWEELRNDVLPDPKDGQRFEVTRRLLEERVEWDNPILVSINDHLYAVGSDQGRIVTCDCGHEFCSLSDNWKHHARVRVREDESEHREIYPEYGTPHPDWDFQLREWLCPGCYAQLDVDAVPVGYPVEKRFEPDVDTFYEEWPGEPAPDRR
jgi:acetone carboxylase gamma subunit